MVDAKPAPEDGDTEAQDNPSGSVPFVPLRRVDNREVPAPDPASTPPGHVPTTPDRKPAVPPAAAGLPNEPAKPKLAPFRATVPGSPSQPANARLSFTLSEIFDQNVPDASPQAVAGAAAASAAAPRAEDLAIAQALERGAKLYPEIMKVSGRAVRDALSSVMPVTFESFANFGTEHLARVAELVGQVATMTDELHKIDAAGQIRAIIAEADQTKAKPSLLDRVGVHKHFDLVAANGHIETIRNALTTELYKVRKASVDFERAAIPLHVAAAVTGILAAMTDKADIGALVARKADLFTASVAEAEMAKKQIENLRKLAEEGILQCDELRNVTLPAMGFQRSL